MSKRPNYGQMYIFKWSQELSFNFATQFSKKISTLWFHSPLFTDICRFSYPARLLILKLSYLMPVTVPYHAHNITYPHEQELPGHKRGSRFFWGHVSIQSLILTSLFCLSLKSVIKNSQLSLVIQLDPIFQLAVTHQAIPGCHAAVVQTHWNK